MKIESNALQVICNTIFRFFRSKDNETKNLLVSILRIFDIEVNFENEYIEYYVDADSRLGFTPINTFSYKATRIDIPNSDLEDLENLLNDNYTIAGNVYPLFAFIGYVLKLEEERWKLVPSIH